MQITAITMGDTSSQLYLAWGCIGKDVVDDDDARLMAIFQENLDKAVPECLHSGFYWAKDDGGSGDNWSYKTCKATVKSSPLTNHHRNIFKGRMSFLLPIQPCLSTEGRQYHASQTYSPQAHLGSVMLILVLVLKDSLRTKFKSLSLSWSLCAKSLLLSLSLQVKSLSLSWSLCAKSLLLSLSLQVLSLSL